MQIAKCGLAFKIVEDDLFRECQHAMCADYQYMTRQRAVDVVLPAIVVQCNMRIAADHNNDEPVCLSVDGVQKRHGFKIDAFMCAFFVCFFDNDMWSLQCCRAKPCVPPQRRCSRRQLTTKYTRFGRTCWRPFR